MVLSRRIAAAAVDLISITDQVARSLIPRERLRDLACNPFRGRMRCDVDPHKVSAGQPNDDEDIQQIEASGRHNEQNHGGDVRCVVTINTDEVFGTHKGFDRVTIEIFDADLLVPSTLHDACDAHGVVAVVALNLSCLSTMQIAVSFSDTSSPT
jgi:hypothetical protein